MRYATFGYAQIESILATVLRTYLRSARMKGSLVANARKTLRLWLMQGSHGRPRGGIVLLEVSRSTGHAGDHKGPPFRSTPPSPLRTVMSFLIVDAYQGR